MYRYDEQKTRRYHYTKNLDRTRKNKEMGQVVVEIYKKGLIFLGFWDSKIKVICQIEKGNDLRALRTTAP